MVIGIIGKTFYGKAFYGKAFTSMWNIVLMEVIFEYYGAAGSSAILRFSLKSSYKNTDKRSLSHSCK